MVFNPIFDSMNALLFIQPLLLYHQYYYFATMHLNVPESSQYEIVSSLNFSQFQVRRNAEK